MQYFEWAFGKRQTPQEQLRKHQRALEKTQRELDRERTRLEAQEKKLINDIRKTAKEGHTQSAKVMAKDLVRTRNHIQKFYAMKTQLQTISLRIQTVRGNQQMAQSMLGASKLLGNMNRQMNLPQLSKIAMDFERQADIMDQRQEMMDDAIEDSMGNDEIDEDEESEEIVAKVLDEIGIDMSQQLGSVPSTQPQLEMNDDLEARLDSLKR
ncbi:ESCRT-III subunit protein [Starmerella bacillaris]|uniref:ESCRT-III subunit protein n=1 Tax=Starmerella bacillaris TaxID=1247836 RepID=A0AAV5RDA9_STABA|nr:ESCRT-III subunit protein [Starmerella bacillaris]